MIPRFLLFGLGIVAVCLTALFVVEAWIIHDMFRAIAGGAR